MTLLPGGMYMGYPCDVAKSVADSKSFHLEFCWLEAPAKRQRLVRTYDVEGLAVSSTYFSEIKFWMNTSISFYIKHRVGSLPMLAYIWLRKLPKLLLCINLFASFIPIVKFRFWIDLPLLIYYCSVKMLDSHVVCNCFILSLKKLDEHETQIKNLNKNNGRFTVFQKWVCVACNYI